MGKIRIIKKNDMGSMEYEIGDIFEIEGTWYGGVHISGRTGIPVSLDKEEYVELMSEMEDKGSEINEEGKRTVAENQEQDIKAEGKKNDQENQEKVSKDNCRKTGLKAQNQETKKECGKTGLKNQKQEETLTPEREIRVGDIVQHFKREWVSEETSEYLYKILAFAEHTETGEKLVIYQALYAPFKTCARPFEMFMSQVDRQKYPNVKQKYRFEKIVLDDICR